MRLEARGGRERTSMTLLVTYAMALPPVLARFSPLAERGDRERTPIEALTR